MQALYQLSYSPLLLCRRAPARFPLPVPPGDIENITRSWPRSKNRFAGAEVCPVHPYCPSRPRRPSRTPTGPGSGSRELVEPLERAVLVEQPPIDRLPLPVTVTLGTGGC